MCPNSGSAPSCGVVSVGEVLGEVGWRDNETRNSRIGR